LKTRTYRLDHDLGFAPNPFFGWCTLACCKPKIRSASKIGDLVIGIAGASRKGLGRYHPQIIYWMRVDEAMTFDQYWEDPRFSQKLPLMTGPKITMVGDRTYRREQGKNEWQYNQSMHYLLNAKQRNGGHVVTDTSVDRVLISKTFTYWGKSGPKVEMRHLDLFPLRHHKCPSEGPLLDELFELLRIDHPQGLVGDPADWDNKKYFS